ncbi:MAG: AAA family ATPase [Bacteroidales bacterium]|nr:AAA family ATPase [Bacteroidales bacterium]MDE7102757.1 AAA family ATPase [Bacteroidales bacterium]
MVVIGITGTLGAGKGTVVDYIVSHLQFKHFSVRDFLTAEIQKNGLAVNRDSMTETANRLRAEHGASYIVDQLFEQAVSGGQNAIIESIRATAEVEALRKKAEADPNRRFLLLSVDAPIDTRFRRISERGSATDHVDFDTFKANEAREMNNADPTKQNLSACMEMADAKLDNSGSLAYLHAQIEQVLAAYKPRPDWDEYFMGLCHSVAQRATCNRGKSGCVIVKDKQILVTGYVGSPAHLPHCDEVGHLFKQMVHEDGHTSTHCVRTVHAEQNAICQAAKRGIALEGATLYCTMTPCRTCAMLIINCGIRDVVCEYRYHAGAESEEMFRIAGVSIRYFHDEVLQYKNQ